MATNKAPSDTTKNTDLFLCTNCSRTFASPTVYNIHFSYKRPACAYKTDEPVTNLHEFTAEALAASAKKI